MRAAVFALTVLLCFIMVWLIWARRDLQDHLGNSGWLLFVAPNSGACTRQLAIVSPRSLAYSPTYVCGRRGRHEADARMSCPGRYPRWLNIYTGEARDGVQSRAELRKMVRADPAAATRRRGASPPRP